MNWFAKTTIGTRLIGLAILSTVLTLGVGAFGVSRTSDVSDMLNAMYDNNLVPIALMGEASLQSSGYDRAVYRHLADASGFDARLEATMKDHESRMKAALDTYRATWLTEPEKELIRRFDQAWPPYSQLVAQVLEHERAGRHDAAVQLMNGDASRGFAAVSGILGDLVDVNQKLGRKAYDDSDVVVAEMKVQAGAVIGLAALLAIGLGVFVSRSVTRPLGGEPAAVAEAAKAIAAGDLAQPIAVRPGDRDSVVACMAEMQRSLASVVASVRLNAESVASASEQIAEGNQDLSSRTEEQASALQQTAASMEQLNTTVRHNSDNAQQANQLALSASAVAEQGGQVVGQVVETMREINQSSSRIADIIATIDSIAFQTNILALNAAVEAARAGEQGRGFAVVASEVRSLAQRSGDAAKEIRSLISASVERVAQGSELVDRAGGTMNDLVHSIKRVTDIVGDISRASVEQSSGVTQVGSAVSQMDQATQQNAALVEQSAAAADSLKAQARQLVEAVNVFRLGAEGGAAAAPTATRALAA